MKKRKPPEQGRPDFNNTPFSSLKKLKPSITAPRQPPAPPSVKAPHEDDEELFRRAMSGARRIAGDAEELHSAGKQEPGQAPATEPAPDEQELFLKAMLKMGSTLRLPEAESDPEDQPRQSSSARMKQFKRGTIRIGAELDLHGCLRDEALAKLKQFLGAAVARGQKAVLIITGKGINSPEGPVLLGAVADWLRGPGKSIVAEFAPAPRDKGGSGAYVVFLKNG